MPSRRSLSLLLFILLALIGAKALRASGGTLVGTWRLVEQRYERGERNVAQDFEPVRLAFADESGRIAGHVSGFGQHGLWPLYPTPEGPAAIDSVVVRVAPDARSVEAFYRVLPPPGDDTALRVVESYRVDDDGRLVGTMTIRFERGGELRGGYVWTRAFEREGSR